MRILGRNFIAILLVSLAVILPSDNSIAQNIADNNKDSSKKNIEENIEKNTAEKITDQKNQLIDNVSNQINDLNNSVLLNEIRDDIAATLLSNKSVSLMLNEEEEENTNKAMESFKNNEIFPLEGDMIAENPEEKKDEFINEKSYLYLASILYLSDKNWVVWINDKKITSQENDKKNDIYISSISRDKVSIIWNISPTKLRVLLGEKAQEFNSKINQKGFVEVRFSFHPNQTYILVSQKIVEGKNLETKSEILPSI